MKRRRVGAYAVLGVMGVLAACEAQGMRRLGVRGSEVKGSVFVHTQEGMDGLRGLKTIEPCDTPGLEFTCRGSLEVGRRRWPPQELEDVVDLPAQAGTIRSLAPLGDLTDVASDVVLLNQPLASLVGFPAELHVGGSVVMEHLDALTSATHLEGIRQTTLNGDLVIRHLPVLEVLSLPRVEVIEGSLVLGDLPALHTLNPSVLREIRGDLVLEDLGALRRLDGVFPELATLGGKVRVQGNPRLMPQDLSAVLGRLGHPTDGDVVRSNGTQAYDEPSVAPGDFTQTVPTLCNTGLTDGPPIAAIGSRVYWLDSQQAVLRGNSTDGAATLPAQADPDLVCSGAVSIRACGDDHAGVVTGGVCLDVDATGANPLSRQGGACGARAIMGRGCDVHVVGNNLYLGDDVLLDSDVSDVRMTGDQDWVVASHFDAANRWLTVFRVTEALTREPATEAGTPENARIELSDGTNAAAWFVLERGVVVLRGQVGDTTEVRLWRFVADPGSGAVFESVNSWSVDTPVYALFFAQSGTHLYWMDTTQRVLLAQDNNNGYPKLVWRFPSGVTDFAVPALVASPAVLGWLLPVAEGNGLPVDTLWTLRPLQ